MVRRLDAVAGRVLLGSFGYRRPPQPTLPTALDLPHILATAPDMSRADVLDEIEDMVSGGGPEVFEPIALLYEMIGARDQARTWFRRHCLAQPWARGEDEPPEQVHAFLANYIDAIETDEDLPAETRTRLLERLYHQRGGPPAAVTDGGEGALPVVLLPMDRARGVSGWTLLPPFAMAGRADLLRPRVFSRAEAQTEWVAPILCVKTSSLLPQNLQRPGGWFLLDGLPRALMDQVRDGRGSLLINLGREALFEPRRGGNKAFKAFLGHLDQTGIPRNRVIFLDGNLNSAAIAAELVANDGSGVCPPIVSKRYLWMEMSGVYRKARNLADGVDHPLVLASQTGVSGVPREKAFLSFNGLPRPHRWALVAFLHERGLLDRGLVSFNPHVREAAFAADQVSEGVAALVTLDRPGATIEALASGGALKVDVDYRAAGAARWALCYGANETWPFMSSYFSVITDTRFSDGRTNIVTEKAMKTIANLHPFVFIGDPGALADLRSHGYRTFAPWIDESYDEILNPRARMAAVLSEVERLASLPLAALRELYRECWPTLVHNYEVFMRSAPVLAEDIAASIAAARPA